MHQDSNHSYVTAALAVGLALTLAAIAGPAVAATAAALQDTTPQEPEGRVPAAASVARAARTAGTAAVRAAIRARQGDRVARMRGDLPPIRVIKTRATWYGPGFHGRRTASGERFNQNALTLAHRHLPFGTRVRVVNPRTGRSAIARVNDRGPFGHRGYTADLSKGLAQKVGLRGTGPVHLEILPGRKK